MSIGISDGTNVIVFGAGGYGVIGEVTVSAATARRITRNIARATVNPYVDMQPGGELEWRLPLRITGTSADDLSAKIRVLNAILTAGGTLVDQLNGGSTSVSYVLNPCLPIRPNRSRNVEARSSWEGELTLYTVSVATGAAVAIFTAEAANDGPSLLDTGWLTGDGPAPLDIVVNAGWTTAGNGMRRCFVGLTPTLTLADYLYQAEAATGWTLGTDASCGPGASDNERHTSSATWADLDFGAVPAGRYRVVARANRTGGDASSLALSEDGATAYQETAIGGVVFTVYDIGEFQSDGVSPLHVLGKTEGTIWVDYILLFPVDDGLASFATSAFEIDSWQLTADPTLTDTSSVEHPAARYMTGGQLECPCDGRGLLIAVSDEDGTEANPDLTVSVSYVPQFYSWADA